MSLKSLTAFSLATLASSHPPAMAASPQDLAPVPQDRLLSANDPEELRALYRRLIDAENRHDIAAVKPNALFVAKTATPAEGNWAGFWGTDTVSSISMISTRPALSASTRITTGRRSPH